MIRLCRVALGLILVTPVLLNTAGAQDEGAAYRHGVRLLPGTDLASHQLSGAFLHWELESFAEAGIPPLDILRFATQASAETVGAGDDLGTLEVGKLADIVLLDANPLEDIKNT